MDSDASAHRYTREEMRRILELASESPPGGPDAVQEGEGVTLSEIQEIAQEVGIDPVRVERASAIVRRTRVLDPRAAFGTYQQEAHFGRSLNKEDMRFAAQAADWFFDTSGTLREASGQVEWHSREAGAFVGIVREGDDTRVRVIVDRARQFLGGAVVISLAGLTAIANLLPGASAVTGLLGGVGVAVGTAGLVLGFWHWRRERLIHQIRQLLDAMTAGLSTSDAP